MMPDREDIQRLIAKTKQENYDKLVMDIKNRLARLRRRKPSPKVIASIKELRDILNSNNIK